MEKRVTEKNIAILRPLERRLYTTAARQLEQELLSYVQADVLGIVLNLQDVELIDRCGLSTIVSIFKRLAGKADFVLCHVSPAVHDLLKITKSDAFLSAFPSEEEAITFLKRRCDRRLRMGQVRFQIESDFNQVPLVGITVHALCAAIPLPDVDAYQIEMCVVEAVNNAIEHTYENQPGRPIEVQLCIDIDTLILTVHDEGRGMPEQAIAPDLDYDPEDLDTLPEGGMGLYLINSVMDDVSYKAGQEGNTLTMTKAL